MANYFLFSLALSRLVFLLLSVSIKSTQQRPLKMMLQPLHCSFSFVFACDWVYPLEAVGIELFTGFFCHPSVPVQLKYICCCPPRVLTASSKAHSYETFPGVYLRPIPSLCLFILVAFVHFLLFSSLWSTSHSSAASVSQGSREHLSFHLILLFLAPYHCADVCDLYQTWDCRGRLHQLILESLAHEGCQLRYQLGKQKARNSWIQAKSVSTK